ncbi:hypothetical protein [Rhizobium mongolense]|uniref:hypothetical protein n=1 Tax=Rhizobium mongolense TaxID=57676 RepID=UPI003F5F85EE
MNRFAASLLFSLLPGAAPAAWLKANPKAIDPWLFGVTTLEGKLAADAVKSSLGL